MFLSTHACSLTHADANADADADADADGNTPAEVPATMTRDEARYVVLIHRYVCLSYHLLLLSVSLYS